MAVHGSGEHDAGDDGDRLPLRVCAALRAPAALGRWRRRLPTLRAGLQIERCQTARHVGRLSGETGERDVEVAVVRSRAPFDAPNRLAFGYFGLPENLAGPIGIESRNEPGSLSRQNDLLAVAQGAQD